MPVPSLTRGRGVSRWLDLSVQNERNRSHESSSSFQKPAALVADASLVLTPHIPPYLSLEVASLLLLDPLLVRLRKTLPQLARKRETERGTFALNQPLARSTTAARAAEQRRRIGPGRRRLFRWDDQPNREAKAAGRRDRTTDRGRWSSRRRCEGSRSVSQDTNVVRRRQGRTRAKGGWR